VRIAFVGASPLAVHSVEALCKRGHDVVLIDTDAKKIEELSDVLDCGFVTGDGSRPSVLEEIGPDQTDFLFCLSDRDESNILAALVGRSLGFDRVVPKLEDPDLETICTELGLDDVIVPDRELATHLIDLVERGDSPELTAVVRSGLRFFALIVPEGTKVVADLELPAGARLVARTRGDESVIGSDDVAIQAGDELVLIVDEDHLDELRDRFASASRREEGR